MTRKFLPYWMTPEIMKAAAVMAAMLFVVSYLVDLTLMRLDVSPSSTILNDIAIALIATGVMLFYLFVTHTQNIFLRAKERMNSPPSAISIFAERSSSFVRPPKSKIVASVSECSIRRPNIWITY